ncbi:B-block binding subunit of TFIIIC domain-containing protein [Entamoeba marina]
MIRTRTCFEELWEFARISDHLHSPKSRDNKMESEKSVSGEEILKQESVEMSDDFTEEESTETKSKHFFKPIINEYSNVEECLQQREENEHGVKIRLMEFINQLPTNMFHKLIGIVKTSCPFGKDIVYSTTPIKDLPPTERNWILSNKSWIKRFNVIVGVLRNLRLLHRDLDSEHADGMILSTHGIFYVQKTDLSIIKEIRFALKSKKVIDSYFDSLQSASFQLNDYEGYTVIINGLQETGYIIKPMAWQNKAVTLTKPQRAMIYDHIYNEETVFDKQKLSEETGFSNAQVELVIRQYTQRCEKKSAVMDKRLKIRKFTPRGKKDVPKVWETADDKKIIKAYKNYWYNVNDTTDSIPDSLPAHILKRLAKSCNVRVKQVADRLKSLVKSEDVFGVIDDSNMSDYDDERDDQDDQIEQIEQTVNERTETIDYDQSVIKKNDVSMTFETPEERDEIYKCLAMLRLTPEEIRDKKIDVIELFNIHEDSLQLLLDKKCVCKDKNPFNPMTLTLSQRYFSLLESKIFNNNFFEKRPIFPPNGIIVSVPPYDINQIHTTSIILLQEMKDVKLFIFPNMENEQNMPNSSLVLYKIDVDGLFVYEKGTHWYTDLDYLTTSPSFSMQQINLINEIKFVFDEFDRASQPLTIIGILNRFETQPDSLDYVLSYLLFINVISRFSQVEMPMEQDNFNQEPPQTDHITPWTTYSGDVNIEIYQTLLHRLKCFIFKYPSISVENLCKKFPFAHEDTMILLQQLVNEEIVEIRENGLFGDGFYVFPKCSSLFS